MLAQAVAAELLAPLAQPRVTGVRGLAGKAAAVGLRVGLERQMPPAETAAQAGFLPAAVAAGVGRATASIAELAALAVPASFACTLGEV